MLIGAGNAVEMSFFQQACSGLMVAEGHVGFDALPADREHPFVVARAGLGARFAAYGDFLYGRRQIGRQLQRPQQRCANDYSVADRRFKEAGQTPPAISWFSTVQPIVTLS